MRYQASSWRGWTRTRRRLVPMGEEASALAVADEVGLEPAGEPVLTGGCDQPVGDEDEGAVGEGDAFGLSEVLVEDRPEAQLVEQGPDDQDRPPGGGIDRRGVPRDRRNRRRSSPARRRRSLGSSSTRRSLRPRSATTRCLTLPPSR